MRRRGGGNSFGALKGKLTRHANENIRKWEDEERSRKVKEIESNKSRFYRAIDRLRINDSEFDNWYDSNAVPEYIHWTGKEFEDVLKIMRKRLKSVKQR